MAAGSEFNIRLRDYDHVDQMATFSFFGESGNVEMISIHKRTFYNLVTKGAWDEKKYGSITSQQQKFIRALKAEVRGDLVSWYEEVTNEYMKMIAIGNRK